MNIVHIYIRIYSAYVLVKETHTHTQHTRFLSTLETYRHTHRRRGKTLFITSPGRSLVDKVITFWNDFCLSYFENRQLLLMLDSLLPTAPNCLHEKKCTLFQPSWKHLQSDVYINLFIEKKRKKKSSPHPHRTAIPICSSVPLVRARMLFKGTSTGRCETCFYLKFCDLFCLALLSCANYNQAWNLKLHDIFFFWICQTEITFQLTKKKQT